MELLILSFSGSLVSATIGNDWPAERLQMIVVITRITNSTISQYNFNFLIADTDST